MLMSNRDRRFEIGIIPEVKETISGYKLDDRKKFDFISNSLVVHMKEKYHWNFDNRNLHNIEYAIDQTIKYLLFEDLIKISEVKLKSIRWWSKWINLGPKYEGIRNGIREMVIKERKSDVYSEIKKGAVYGSLNLDVIGTAIEYTLEYLHKNDLLRDVDKGKEYIWGFKKGEYQITKTVIPK